MIATIGSIAARAAGDAVGAVADDDGLRGSVQHIAAGDFALADHDGTAGNEAGNSHSPVLAGGVTAQHRPVPVLYGKFRTGDRLASHGVQLGQS